MRKNETQIQKNFHGVLVGFSEPATFINGIILK